MCACFAAQQRMDKPITVIGSYLHFEIRRQIGAALHVLAARASTEALRTSCLDLAHHFTQLTNDPAAARSRVLDGAPTPNQDRSSTRKTVSQAIQSIAAKGTAIFFKSAEPSSYPSRRPCPSCGGKMFYIASTWRRYHARTCGRCGYSDEKVKLVKTL